MADTPAFDYVIVGGGLAGRTLARCLADGSEAVSVALVAESAPVGGGGWFASRRPSPLAFSLPQPGLNGRSVPLQDAWLTPAIADQEAGDWGDPAWCFEALDPPLPGPAPPAAGPEVERLSPAGGPWQTAFLNAADETGLLLAPSGREAPPPEALDLPACVAPWTGAQVLRLRFDGRRAVGVDLRCEDGSALSLAARREVLLCAGALRNPQLLQVSGVGDGAAVQKAGIRFKHHLPGVGAHLQDRLGFSAGFRVVGGGADADAAAFKGLLRLAAGSARPEAHWQFACGLADTRWRAGWPWRRRLASLRTGLLQPASCGWVQAAGPDALVPPQVHPGHFDDLSDLDRSVDLYRQVQRFLLARAWAGRLANDLAKPATGDGLAIREDLRERSVSLSHFAGTCRMGDDALAVVDAGMRVHGLQAVRVVDASVLPALAGGSPAAHARLLAEWAAKRVLADIR